MRTFNQILSDADKSKNESDLADFYYEYKRFESEFTPEQRRFAEEYFSELYEELM